MVQKSSRAIRICGVSGSALDRRDAFVRICKSDDNFDVVIGDWLSEGNMTSMGKILALGEKKVLPTYEPSFLSALKPALPDMAKRGIKLAVNAGASDTKLLCDAVEGMVTSLGLSLKTAWISGDEVPAEHFMGAGDSGLIDLSTGKKLDSFRTEPLYAQAYLGGVGIATAFEQGADIVICGRVADASPVIGASMWWHGWKADQFDELASALVAGHLIECSSYVTGGNFSGFKNVPDKVNLSYPIAEIGSLGQVEITKVKGLGGAVTIDTVKAQLLYEIQGQWYYNSDVTAKIDGITLSQIADNRVQVGNIVGLPAPPTTKVGVTGRGGYQAEVHWSIVGLDVEEKAALLKANIETSLGEDRISRLSLLSFTLNGRAPDDPQSQTAATVDFRVFAQAASRDDIAPENFMQPILDVIMCSYPGATPQPGLGAAMPRQYCEYYVALIPQSAIQHRVHMKGRPTITIPAPTVTRQYPIQQPSSTFSEPDDSEPVGRTTRGPLGWLVHARSGDKGSNANVGFWVRSEEQYSWLRRLLTIGEMKRLLGQEYKSGSKIDRLEFPGLFAVHFLLHDHLDRGVNSTSSYDLLGKNLAEFLRSRWVDLPLKFLEDGKI